MKIGIQRLQKAIIVLAFALFGCFAVQRAMVAQAAPGTAAVVEKPYLVEWVYRVKYGYKDEWWAIFQKYQIAILDKEKELGYLKDYTIVAPGLHTSEESRWDYRVEITYKNQEAAGHGAEVGKQLFPDRQAVKKEENRRWELTENHWDLPIHPVDPHEQR
jgi:hypothetical protein